MKRAVSETKHAQKGENAPRTLSEAAYQCLRRDVLWGELEPGMALRSDSLRKRYDIGSSPLREALTRLACEGLVHSSEQRGFRVAPLEKDHVRDVLNARILIESEAVRRSIEYGDVDWETGILSSNHQLSKMLNKPGYEPESTAWCEIHRGFHFALMDACGSEWLLKMASMLYDQAERHRLVAENRRVAREAAGVTTARASSRLREHKNLTDAALARDSEKTIKMLTRHHVQTAEYVLVCLDADSDSVDSSETSAATNKSAAKRQPKSNAKQKARKAFG
ncbi:MAG: FCD domain-containing protein [Gammaproteobacteria bacterium]|nr:FCD domain-containing protein [Gammaproteobacteria bacterium]MDH3466432.1 FCD domain-containing protein [Gammaproteobacteria bacterium]